MKIVFLF